MRNIWQIVVGVVLVIGVGIAIYNGVEGDSSEPRRAESREPAPATGSADADQTQSGEVAQFRAPEPESRFDKVEIADDDFILGKPDAPVTIVEYASLTCPHCARFHATVLPVLKKEYVDTGKVRIVYRDFPLNQPAVVASMLARCAGRERFFGFIDILYRTQPQWADPQSNYIIELTKIARLGGVSQEAFEACLKDESLQTAVLQQRLEGARKFKVNSTPTIIVNGSKYISAMSPEQMRAIVESMLPKS